MNKKVSVIVPVYNVEKYLKNCVESLINQTYENIEIILVDDGSTDNSGKICDELSKKDNRIIVIHKENEGVSKARNTALEQSCGEYISFVDSDDSLEAGSYENLVQQMESNDLDVLAFQYYINEKDSQENNDDVTLVSCEEALTRCVSDNEEKCFIPAVWNKLYRVETLKEYLKFCPQYIIAEDMLVTMKVLKHAHRIGEIHHEYYNYTQREESVMHVYKKNKCSTIYAHEEIYEELINDYPQIAESVKIRSVEQAFSIMHEALNTQQLFMEDVVVLLEYLRANEEYFAKSDTLDKRTKTFFKLVCGRKISKTRIRIIHRLLLLKNR